MTWKKILKEDEEDEEDYYVEQTKDLIQDFNNMKKSIDSIQKRYQEIESVVQEYADLMLKLDDELMELVNIDNGLDQLDGKSARDFHNDVFQKYEEQAYATFRQMKEPMIEMSRKVFDVRI